MTKKLLPDPDLEALIRRLNEGARADPAAAEPEVEPPTSAKTAEPAARWPLPAADDDARAWLERLLADARRLAASDLLLVAGAAPTARVNGRLQPLTAESLSPSATAALCGALIPAARRPVAEREASADFALTQQGLGHLRCNVHRERGHWSAAIRLLPDRAPDLGELHLPETLGRFADLDHGLVLVTGPTGSGKSTTLAALVRRILARRKVHLITIEDPVEYTHAHGESVVEHVEIGRDARSFDRALRSVLRQDPDVLLIGEMRDRKSIAIAITAAETGHLVLATLHTGDAPQTIHRILDSYPPGQIDTVRVQLSVSLAGVISQQLLPAKDGKGRVPAVEVLIATPAVRNLIRLGKIEQVRSQILLEQAAGMYSLDRSLAELVAAGWVERDEARSRARDFGDFDAFLRRQGK